MQVPSFAQSTREAVVRDRLIRLPEVERLAGIRKSTIYGLMAKAQFPRCVQVTPRCVAWSECAVLRFVQDRLAEADPMPTAGAPVREARHG